LCFGNKLVHLKCPSWFVLCYDKGLG
jgi:hypothetical protein